MKEHFIFQKTRQNCASSRCIAVFRAISGCTSKHRALRMNKTGRLSILLFSLPFLAGCFSVTTLPVPRTQPEREALTLRGIVISDGTEEQVIQYDKRARRYLDAVLTLTRRKQRFRRRHNDGDQTDPDHRVERATRSQTRCRHDFCDHRRAYRWCCRHRRVDCNG